MRFGKICYSIVAAGALTTGVVSADIPPPDGYTETCTIDTYDDGGVTCVSCDADYSKATICQTTWEPKGYTKKCKSRGASAWTEVWCGTPSDASADTGQPDARVAEAGLDAAKEAAVGEAGLGGTTGQGGTPSEAGAGSTGAGGKTGQGGSVGKGGAGAGGVVATGGAGGTGGSTAAAGAAGTSSGGNDGGCSAAAGRVGGLASGLMMLALAAVAALRKRRPIER